MRSSAHYPRIICSANNSSPILRGPSLRSSPKTSLGELIAKAEAMDSPQRVVLDMDSTEIPV
jgi:hypothetical protein